MKSFRVTTSTLIDSRQKITVAHLQRRFLIFFWIYIRHRPYDSWRLPGNNDSNVKFYRHLFQKRLTTKNTSIR